MNGKIRPAPTSAASATQERDEQNNFFRTLATRLTYKRTPCEVFTEGELEHVANTWGSRKSAPPHGVSYEGLKAIVRHGEAWKHRLLEVFNDALYRALLPNVDDSLTEGEDTTW